MKRKAIAAVIAAMMAASLGTTALADASGDIVVCSREDGSGTRGAFIELVGVEQKDDDGNKVDMTTEAAEITNSTSAMMTKVAGDENAIGYISLGSLDDSVTAVAIDGVEATVENVESGDYTVVRPFNILTMEEVSEEAQDFIDFILSDEGQAVVSENGYIALSDTEPFAGGSVSGKITVGGSSSVTPVMEKLAEAYSEINADLEIEVMQSDSTTGVTSTIDGNYDIGMASRELKDEEVEEGVTSIMIAQDGIAVIVNNDNGITELTTEQVMQIYTGEITTWEELQ
ncbi:MAG: substrate-binding domain-containing protein [Lachnospiraceae bacterium]|nr:substrate-binding domain-containing protein [Lachnospiraceae bacterium]